MLNNLTFDNSKNYFIYFNTLLYNTHNIKDFIFFTTSFKYSFVILPLCLFLSFSLSLSSFPPPPNLSLSLLWSKSNQQIHTSFFSTQQTPPLYSQPYNPIPTTSHQIKRKKKKTPATLPKIMVFKFGPFNELKKWEGQGFWSWTEVESRSNRDDVIINLIIIHNINKYIKLIKIEKLPKIVQNIWPYNPINHFFFNETQYKSLKKKKKVWTVVDNGLSTR